MKRSSLAPFNFVDTASAVIARYAGSTRAVYLIERKLLGGEKCPSSKSAEDGEHHAETDAEPVPRNPANEVTRERRAAHTAPRAHGSRLRFVANMKMPAKINATARPAKNPCWNASVTVTAD